MPFHFCGDDVCLSYVYFLRRCHFDSWSMLFHWPHIPYWTGTLLMSAISIFFLERNVSLGHLLLTKLCKLSFAFCVFPYTHSSNSFFASLWYIGIILQITLGDYSFLVVFAMFWNFIPLSSIVEAPWIFFFRAFKMQWLQVCWHCMV